MLRCLFIYFFFEEGLVHVVFRNMEKRTIFFENRMFSSVQSNIYYCIEIECLRIYGRTGIQRWF